MSALDFRKMVKVVLFAQKLKKKLGQTPSIQALVQKPGFRKIVKVVLFTQRLHNLLPSPCAICLEDIKRVGPLRALSLDDVGVRFSCKGKHEFHLECINGWMSNLDSKNKPHSCPTCREVDDPNGTLHESEATNLAAINKWKEIVENGHQCCPAEGELDGFLNQIPSLACTSEGSPVVVDMLKFLNEVDREFIIQEMFDALLTDALPFVRNEFAVDVITMLLNLLNDPENIRAYMQRQHLMSILPTVGEVLEALGDGHEYSHMAEAQLLEMLREVDPDEAEPEIKFLMSRLGV